MKRTLVQLFALMLLIGVVAPLAGCNGGGAQVDENALQKEQQDREKFNKENGVESGN